MLTTKSEKIIPPETGVSLLHKLLTLFRLLSMVTLFTLLKYIAKVHSFIAICRMDGWMGWDGMGWDKIKVIIGHRYSKSTFGANKNKRT